MAETRRPAPGARRPLPPPQYQRRPAVPQRNPPAFVALALAIASLPFALLMVFALLGLLGRSTDRVLLTIASAPWPIFMAEMAVALAAVAAAIVALLHPANRSRWQVGRVPAIIALFVAGPVLLASPAALAILVPALLKANDSLALRDVRDVMVAQTWYAEQNGGYYDTLECVAAAERCLGTAAGEGPITPARIVPERYGHRRTLVLGAPAAPGEAKPRSPSARKTFAFVSIPIRPGRTGLRAFCADHTSRVCVLQRPEMPVLEKGACPQRDCRDVSPF